MTRQQKIEKLLWEYYEKINTLTQKEKVSLYHYTTIYMPNETLLLNSIEKIIKEESNGEF